MTPFDFLQEILANPDDDTPRLIYADWLDERSDPRGEFIRVQCELAALTKPPERWLGMYRAPSPYSAPQLAVRASADLPRFRQLLARQLSLSMAHGADWVRPLGPQMTGVLFSRGFVEGCSIRAADYARQAADWYRLTPIRRLHVKHIGEYLAAMLGSPFLQYVQTLDFQPSGRRLHDHEAALLAACPNLANLRNLGLGSNQVTERGIQALLGSPWLKQLRRLRGVNPDVHLSLRSALGRRFGEIA